MSPIFSGRARVPALLAFVSLALLAGPRATAQQPQLSLVDEPSSARIDKIERQNEELRRQLQEQQELIRQLQQQQQQPEKVPEPKKEPEQLPPPQPKKEDAPKKDGDAKKDAEPKKDDVVVYEVGKDLKMGVTWRDGMFLETADKAFSFNVGGRVDFDMGWHHANHELVRSIGQFNNFADPNLGLSDGTDFRRARLRFQATFWDVGEFVCEYDFANFADLRRRTLGIPTSPTDFPSQPPVTDFDPGVTTRFTDVWVGLKNLPWIGTFRAGHQKEWITFSNATSGRFLTFMERPLLFDAFNSDFQWSNGLTLQNNFLNERAYYWFGFFKANSNLGAFDFGDGDYVLDTRWTALPVWLDDGNVWAHVGVDFSHRALHFNQTRFRSRPLIWTGANFQVPNILNTGAVFSRDPEELVNFEFASAWGPLTLTSEYTMVFINNTFTGGLPAPDGSLPDGVKARGDYFAQGWYVEALYFLTGEHRGYRREQPGYDRIRPAENFFLVHGPHGPLCGLGAWEVGVRYDWLDLSHGGINGGTANAVTLGLNWHVNPNMKVQWNVVWMRRDFDPPDDAGRRAGDFASLGMRFHWDF